MSKHPPLILQPISAGFPNPAEDASSTPLDLNELMIRRPAATYFMRVDGESMQDAGVHSGDIVVIDKSLEPTSGDMVVAFIDGEFTLKFFKLKDGEGWLVPANNAYEPIKVSDEGQDFQIWGVATFTIHARRS